MKNVSQKNLAEKISVNDKYLCRLERGKSYPSIQILIQIANYLSVELKDFFVD